MGEARHVVGWLLGSESLLNLNLMPIMAQGGQGSAPPRQDIAAGGLEQACACMCTW